MNPSTVMTKRTKVRAFSAFEMSLVGSNLSNMLFGSRFWFKKAPTNSKRITTNINPNVNLNAVYRRSLELESDSSLKK